MSARISREDYLACLADWMPVLERGFYALPGHPGLACYGTGDSDNWSIQTNLKAFSAAAVLAADPACPEERAGIGRAEILARALAMLRFSLAGHLSGDGRCLDGKRWGHTWISMLGLERMMHGVEAIEAELSAADRAGLRRVLLSECDWLMDGYYRGRNDRPGEIRAGTVENNHPENNIWAGTLLHRAAALYPDAPRAAAYRDKGSRFLVNGISVAADAMSREVVDGRPVAEWYAGDNFFPSFALNHHHYLNIGYMVICLSNLAMFHFSCRRAGWTPPEALYHHVADLWRLVKLCTFADGRLLRIGGDTRVRYCYCQDYALPAWLMMLDWLGDEDCLHLEAGWLAQVRREMANNGDGSFLSDRCRSLATVSPLYLERLESDRAASLSMAAFWRRALRLPGGQPAAATRPPVLSGAWADGYHGACLVRGKRRIASWVWLAGERPNGLCLPADDSALAEWRHNLAGEIRGLGRVNHQEVAAHDQVVFPGGFLTWGRSLCRSEVMLCEGRPDETVAEQDLVCAALPDDGTMLILQRARTPRRVDLVSVKGVFLQVPNDLFNGYRRVYRFAGETYVADGRCRAAAVVPVSGGRLEIDRRLTLSAGYGVPGLAICRPGRRQVGLAVRQDKARAGGMLAVDEICGPCRLDRRNYDAGATLYDLGFALAVAPAAAAGSLAAPAAPGWPEVRLLLAGGLDGARYLLAANFGGDPASPAVSAAGSRSLEELAFARRLVPDPDGRCRLSLPARSSRLFRLVEA